VVARKLISISKPDASTYKGWGFVMVVGALLAVLAIIDRGGVGELTAADGSTGCRLEVVADELNVRAEASTDSELVQILKRGDVVDGTREVVDGFRRLENDRWASDAFLSALPNTNCA
jgi:hypothetical protein